MESIGDGRNAVEGRWGSLRRGFREKSRGGLREADRPRWKEEDMDAEVGFQ